MKVGTEITVDQGEIIMRCEAVIDENSLQCIVTKTGKLKSLCIVCGRGVKRTTPYVTKQDLHMVKFALEYQVSDAIMLSREFLAYELEASAVNRMMQIQKWVGAKCLRAGKPFYISGGVFFHALDSGIYVDSEVADVTNALLDGVTGFVLHYCPNMELLLEVIQTINELCCSVEPFVNTKVNFWRILMEIKMPINAAEASALSCMTVANQCNASVVVIPTVTGQTAKTLMWLQPSCGMQKKWYKAMEARVEFAVEYAVKRGWLVYGDTYVTLQRGSEDSAYCDCVRVWKVTISKKAMVE
ncbi:Pyruvate kinase [Operophtera brumata]|uniref:Pyruvate kinase n=1 Tax=Operophtera brumata TaxID=104452 RepID=A0A0L7L0U7_OPEBR|nr:Pyruvate kinase [Operophtera brumata]